MFSTISKALRQIPTMILQNRGHRLLTPFASNFCTTITKKNVWYNKSYCTRLMPGTQIAFFQMQTLCSRRRKMRVKVSTAQRDTFEANDLSAHMLVKKTEEKKLSPTTTRNRNNVVCARAPLLDGSQTLATFASLWKGTTTATMLSPLQPLH